MARQEAHAIVIGASMGGLAAAAALAPHYPRITIFDRDDLPAEPAHRRGVPQSKHAHGLQPGGLRALDVLLPGIGAELKAGGAPGGDVGAHGYWNIGGNPFVKTDADAPSLGLTRPFLEHAVRTRVGALPGVTIRGGVEVSGLLGDTSGSGPARVVGVVAGGEPVRADLVVDAAGRVSKLPEWLAALGYPAPAEELVHCKMAYLTRRWRITNDALGGDIVSVIAPAERPHFGVAIAQEDGSFIVTLGGLLDGAPHKSDEAYLAFARALPDPRVADALADAEPITDYQPSHFPCSRRRRYDKLRAFPDGLLALGDSIASFNPMYGQGMSVAAIEAVELRNQLDRGSLDAPKFFKKAHRIEDVAWKISTGGDLRYDGVEGNRTPDMRLMNAYLDRLTVAARTDPVLAALFLRVAGFMERPESFFKPSVVRRVIRGSRAARRSGAQSASAPLTTAR